MLKLSPRDRVYESSPNRDVRMEVGILVEIVESLFREWVGVNDFELAYLWVGVDLA